MHHPSSAQPESASLEAAGAVAAARPVPSAPARDLSALAWVAPNMRAALDDAVREFREYVADVVANPEVLGHATPPRCAWPANICTRPPARC